MLTRFPTPPWLLPGLRLLACAPLAVACGGPTGDQGEPIASVSAADSCPVGPLLQGVDTSSVQGTVDWTAAKAAGVGWVIMKATQGDYDHDSAFPTSWPAAKAAGVVRGAYHFFDPTVDGVTQANYFLAAMGPLDAADLAPTLDVECPTSPTADCLGGSGGSGAVPAADFRARMLDWLTTVEAATGRKPIIYTYLDFFAETGAAGTGTNVDTTGLDAYPLWIAQYTDTACFSVPLPWTQAAAWQYGDHGSFNGISTEVDVDRMVGPIAALLGSAGVAGDGGIEGGAADAGDAAEVGDAGDSGDAEAIPNEEDGGISVSVSLSVSTSPATGFRCEASGRGAEAWGGGATGTFFGLVVAVACGRRRRKAVPRQLRGNGSRVAPFGFDPSTSLANSVPPLVTVNGPPSSSVTS